MLWARVFPPPVFFLAFSQNDDHHEAVFQNAKKFSAPFASSSFLLDAQTSFSFFSALRRQRFFVLFV